MSNAITSLSLRKSLLSLQSTQRLLDQTQLRLATGRRINSAIDGADNFFAASGLTNQASDLANLLDNLGQNIQTIKEADIGLEGVSNLLNLLQSTTQTALDRDAFAPDQALSEQILEDNPVAYYRLNSPVANEANQGFGAVGNAVYQGVVREQPELYTFQSDVSGGFTGGSRVRIPNSPDINVGDQPVRTVELTFQADSVAGRQVLYEEGGGTNALNIYIDDGQLYANVRDSGDFGPFNISTTIEAGRTYHVAAVFDFPGSGTFTGYLDGESFGSEAVTRSLSSHTGGIGIGRLNGSTHYHDGVGGGGGDGFFGRISDVAIYNDALTENRLKRRANALNPSDFALDLADDFTRLKDQLNQLSNDASYRGVNLLQGDTLESKFNKRGSSFLSTGGENITTQGLGLENLDLSTRENALQSLSTIQSALNQVRRFRASLAVDLNVITTREDFIREDINIKTEGADKLTIADLNEESAKLLALQTNQALGVNSILVTTLARSAITQLF